MSKNIGLLYYKTYFEDLQFNIVTDKVSKQSFDNQALFGINLNSYTAIINVVKSNPLKTHSINGLNTIYPGLLIGSGYSHEIGGKEIENELKLGFFFDHTTGLPCIPGSSIKGVLRSACEQNGGQYIAYILQELSEGKRVSNVQILAAEFLRNYENEILKKRDKHSNFVNVVFENENIPVYKREIFFDAFPVHSNNQNGKFLANDYITPHVNPLKNPNPIQFLKILPKVEFQFDFKLNDRIMPANLKLELFCQIILDLGLGAKTNVGYGQFSEVTAN